MCTFPTAPPTLSFFWPWQAPGQWLVLWGVFALYAALLVRLYRRLPRWTDPGTQRDVVFGFYVAGCTLVLASMGLILTVILPSSNALIVWEGNQAPWADTHQCLQDLYTTARLISSSFGSLSIISAAAIFVGLVIPAVGSAVPSIQRAFAWPRRQWEVRSAAR